MIDGQDSTVIANIARDVGAIVCYSDRRFRNDAEARARFPHLAAAGRVVALAAVVEPPDSELAGDGVDTEPGNLPVGSAAASIKARIGLGHWRPVGYADLSDMKNLISDLHLIGVPTPPPGPGRPWRCYTAHPTGVRHICGPHTCGQLPIDADSTQWWWASLQNPGGPDLDKDVFREDFFPSSTIPPPTPPENTVSIQIGHNADGRQELFAELQSGEVKHIAQSRPNGDWWRHKDGTPNWQSLGNPGK